MRRAWWRWARPLGGAAILVVVAAQLGGDPFRAAVGAVDARALAAGAVIAVGTTIFAAWRWRLVAQRLGIDLSLPWAVAACYRSQLLNVTLPGGVVGDVHRGVHHGREVDDVRRGLRAVAWERTCGQAVLVVATVGALLLSAPSQSLALAATAGVLTAIGLGVAVVVLARRARGLGSRVARAAMADGQVLSAPRVMLGLIVSSIAVVTGHVVTFAVAARTVGIQMSVVELAPLALLILLAAAVPLNLAGWGPREGAAAWVFAAAGADARQGVAAAVAYGVIVMVAALPGIVVLLMRRSGRDRARGAPSGGLLSHGVEDTGEPVEVRLHG